MNVLPFEKQVAIVAGLCEGMSIRATERLTDTHRDTIMRLGVRVGSGCARLHDYLIRDLSPSIIELDELWAFIGKKRRQVKPTDPREFGDCYTFIALDVTNKAIISYISNKRDGVTTEFFLRDLKSRIKGRPLINSDAFQPYETAINVVFGKKADYAQVVKRYHGEPAIDAARRYSPGVVVGIRREVKIGDPIIANVSTSHVERQNLSVRMASRRFTRLTNGFSKKLENHQAAVSLYVTHYNFCRVHEALRITPAMAVGVTDHVWSIGELVQRAISGEIEELKKKTSPSKISAKRKDA